MNLYCALQSLLIIAGALFLDNGIEIADKVFSKTLFLEVELLEVWMNFSPHPLQVIKKFLIIKCKIFLKSKLRENIQIGGHF